jgi:trehalose 6-phosphate synthase
MSSPKSRLTAELEIPKTKANQATDFEAPGGRLLLVSNRLPITVDRDEYGKYRLNMSSGGLATGILSLSRTTSFEWYGWSGLEAPEAEAAPIIQRMRDDYNAHSVFINKDLVDLYYNGFASKCLL